MNDQASSSRGGTREDVSRSGASRRTCHPSAAELSLGSASRAAAGGRTLSPSLRARPADAALPAHSLLSLAAFLDGRSRGRRRPAPGPRVCASVKAVWLPGPAAGWARAAPAGPSSSRARTAGHRPSRRRRWLGHKAAPTPEAACLPAGTAACFLKGRVGVGNEMGVSTSKKDSSEISIALGSQRPGFVFFLHEGKC